MDNLINVQERRGLRVFVAALILLIAGVLLSMKLGAVPLTWSELYQILTGGDTSKIGQIIMTIRLPRVVVGFLAGMNLALAALAAMIIMILMPTYVMLVPIGAFVGALVASFLVYGISWQGGLNPLRLILAGVAVAAFFGGFNTILSVFYPDRVQGTVSWMAGGFVGRSWDDVMMIWPYTAIGIIGSMISIRWLTLLSLGDDTARTLGVHVERCRLSLLVLASLLAASAVSVSGMLGFVGLIVPHVARLIVGVDYRYLIPTSMVFGGILIVYADTLARMMIAPGEIPVGVLMSFLGAPFFLYLLKGVGRR